jgi:hypothetical protein
MASIWHLLHSLDDALLHLDLESAYHFCAFFLRVEAHKTHEQSAPAAPRMFADDFLISSHNDP